MATVPVNPTLLEQHQLASAPPCCARAGDERHRYGCRYWWPRPDWDRFYVEIEHGGATVGHWACGGRALGKLLRRLAATPGPWHYTVILLEGNYLDADHGYLVQQRNLSIEVSPCRRRPTVCAAAEGSCGSRRTA